MNRDNVPAATAKCSPESTALSNEIGLPPPRDTFAADPLCAVHPVAANSACAASALSFAACMARCTPAITSAAVHAEDLDGDDMCVAILCDGARAVCAMRVAVDVDVVEGDGLPAGGAA